jgi:hypothetical protein
VFEDQKVEEEVEKTRMEQIRDATDQRVGSLLVDGLGVELQKKGKSHQKRLKDLLEKMFFTLPEQSGGAEWGTRRLLPCPTWPQCPPKALNLLRIKLLCWYSAREQKELTHPANVRKCRINPNAGPKYCHDYDYDYFEGKTAAGVIFNYQLNSAWCELVFELVFTQLCRS